MNISSPFILLGFILIAIGITFLILPLLAKIPLTISLEQLKRYHPYLLYIYEGKEFFIIIPTPLLALGIVYLIWLLLKLKGL